MYSLSSFSCLHITGKKDSLSGNAHRNRLIPNFLKQRIVSNQQIIIFIGPIQQYLRCSNGEIIEDFSPIFTISVDSERDNTF